MKILRLAVLFIFAALPLRAEVNIQEVTSPGGIKAWLVEEHSIPFVAMELRFRGGASLDAPGKRGAINLMTALLEEGAADKDSRAFGRAAESLAAHFSFDVHADALSISARFLTENQDASVALLRDVLMEPRFDTDAVERVRGQVFSVIQSDMKNPNEIASQKFSETIYGDHPYATSVNGTMDSVAALTRDDLLAAHAAVMAKDRLYVGVVGDITPEQLGQILDDLLGDLAETGADMPPKAKVTFPDAETVVDFATPQSVAIFGQKGIRQEDPDYFAAAILDLVLGGGGFESRLMQEVREKRGLTYGVYSYLHPRDLAEVYIGSVSSANDRIAETIQVIREEWAKAAQDGITEKELRDAKTYMTGAYPLRFDGNGTIANILVGMQMLGLPIDYVVTRNDKVNAVTLDDVNRVARELLDPENLYFVIVGQPEGLDNTAKN